MSQLSLPVAMRWLVVAGAWLRFLVFRDNYTTVYWKFWISALAALTLYASLITVLGVRNPALQDNKSWCLFQVLAETALFSLLYLLTGSPDSDFFLFYFLPLLTAAEHFRAWGVLRLFVIIGLVFTITVLLLSVPITGEMSLGDALLRNVAPRGFFFLFILLLAFVRGNLLKEQTEELKAVRATAIRIANNEAMGARLEAIMDAAVELLDAKGCKVYLRVPERELLELVAVKGVKSDRLKVGYLMPFDCGMAGRVIRSKSPMIEDDYRSSPYRVPELANLFGAVIEVPLLFRQEAIGVLGVLDEAGRRRFSERDISVLQHLAQYAAVALHDMQVVEEVRRQNEALQILSSASQAISANLDLSNAVGSIAECAWELANIYIKKPSLFTYVALLDEDQRYLGFEATYPREHLSKLRNRLDRIDLRTPPIGIVGRAVTTKRTQLVPHVTIDPDYINYNSATRSQLAVPLQGRHRCLGVISVEHTDLSAFPAVFCDTLEVLAAYAATTLDNVYLVENTEAQREEAEVLHKASTIMASASGLNDVAKAILDALFHITEYDRATLQIFDGDYRTLAAAKNLDNGQVDERLLRAVSEDDLVREIIERKEIRILSPPNGDPSWEVLPTTRDIKSWIGIPLVYQETTIGFITVDSLVADHYREEHKKPLELFANHAASVLKNAILLRESAERVEELSQTQEYLETVLDYLEDSRNLVLIGLVYGESIHFARNKLGMAKTLVDNALRGYYGDISDKMASSMKKIIWYINEYLRVLNDTQKEVLDWPPSRPVDVHRTLDRIIASKRISKGVQISKTYRATAPVVHGPEHQLRQVFFVIIQNALDAMGGNGVLGLETQTASENGSTFLRVSISDTGRGIPKSKQPELFDIDVRGAHDRRHRRTGMGMVWARSFMRSYGGDISLASSSDRGTTIRVDVPHDFHKPEGV